MTELTAAHVRALKHADSICFDHTGTGTGRIRAILRAENSPTGFEQTVEIPALASRVERHDGSDGDLRGFAMFTSAKYDTVAQTLVRHLRTGSQFVLMWTRGNASPVTDAAGLVRDELRIVIQAKNAKVADTFNVMTFIGHDNSARMVTVARNYATR